jgi:hypothetical protein
MASARSDHERVPDFVISKNEWVGVRTSPKQHDCPDGVDNPSGEGENERQSIRFAQDLRKGGNPDPAEGYV